MIIDTCALMAIILGEDHAGPLRDALLIEQAALPAPALTEFRRVAARHSLEAGDLAGALIETLAELGLEIVAYTANHADIAHGANAHYGKGMGQGGQLNLLDLMVYAVAKERGEPLLCTGKERGEPLLCTGKERGEPLLCTGKDFAATDLELHAASRPY